MPSVSGSVSVQPEEPFPWLTGVVQGEVGQLEEEIRCVALHFTVLCCAVLCCIALFCTALYSTQSNRTVLGILYYTILYDTVLYCTVLYCTVLYCTVLCRLISLIVRFTILSLLQFNFILSYNVLIFLTLTV